MFQIATCKALHPFLKTSPKTSKGFSLFKRILKALPKDGGKDKESQSAPQLDGVEEQELRKLLLEATSAAPQPLRQFRLLIIGKMGCGKTTILSKVSTKITSKALENNKFVPGVWWEYGKSDPSFMKLRSYFLFLFLGRSPQSWHGRCNYPQF